MSLKENDTLREERDRARHLLRVALAHTTWKIFTVEVKAEVMAWPTTQPEDSNRKVTR